MVERDRPPVFEVLEQAFRWHLRHLQPSAADRLYQRTFGRVENYLNRSGRFHRYFAPPEFLAAPVQLKTTEFRRQVLMGPTCHPASVITASVSETAATEGQDPFKVTPDEYERFVSSYLVPGLRMAMTTLAQHEPAVAAMFNRPILMFNFPLVLSTKTKGALDHVANAAAVPLVGDSSYRAVHVYFNPGSAREVANRPPTEQQKQLAACVFCHELMHLAQASNTDYSVVASMGTAVDATAQDVPSYWAGPTFYLANPVALVLRQMSAVPGRFAPRRYRQAYGTAKSHGQPIRYIDGVPVEQILQFFGVRSEDIQDLVSPHHDTRLRAGFRVLGQLAQGMPPELVGAEDRFQSPDVGVVERGGGAPQMVAWAIAGMVQHEEMEADRAAMQTYLRTVPREHWPEGYFDFLLRGWPGPQFKQWMVSQRARRFLGNEITPATAFRRMSHPLHLMVSGTYGDTTHPPLSLREYLYQRMRAGEGELIWPEWLRQVAAFGELTTQAVTKTLDNPLFRPKVRGEELTLADVFYPMLFAPSVEPANVPGLRYDLQAMSWKPEDPDMLVPYWQRLSAVLDAPATDPYSRTRTIVGAHHALEAVARYRWMQEAVKTIDTDRKRYGFYRTLPNGGLLYSMVFPNRELGPSPYDAWYGRQAGMGPGAEDQYALKFAPGSKAPEMLAKLGEAATTLVESLGDPVAMEQAARTAEEAMAWLEHERMIDHVHNPNWISSEPVVYVREDRIQETSPVPHVLAWLDDQGQFHHILFRSADQLKQEIDRRVGTPNEVPFRMGVVCPDPIVFTIPTTSLWDLGRASQSADEPEDENLIPFMMLGNRVMRRQRLRMRPVRAISPAAEVGTVRAFAGLSVSGLPRFEHEAEPVPVLRSRHPATPAPRGKAPAPLVRNAYRESSEQASRAAAQRVRLQAAHVRPVNRANRIIQRGRRR